MGGKKKYIEMFGSFTEPFSCINRHLPSFWFFLAQIPLQNSKGNILRGMLNTGIGKNCVFDRKCKGRFRLRLDEMHVVMQ